MIIKDKIKLSSFIVMTFIVVTREDVSSSLLHPHHFMSLPGSRKQLWNEPVTCLRICTIFRVRVLRFSFIGRIFHPRVSEILGDSAYPMIFCGHDLVGSFGMQLHRRLIVEFED